MLWCLLLLYILAYLELVNGVIWFLIGQLSKTWRILNHLPEQKLVLLSFKLEFTVRIRQRHVLPGSGVTGTSERPPQPTFGSSSHQGDLLSLSIWCPRQRVSAAGGDIPFSSGCSNYLGVTLHLQFVWMDGWERLQVNIKFSSQTCQTQE